MIDGYDHALRRVLEPGRIGSLGVPHRIVMGAMHLNLETRDDAGAALAEFYAARARGGAGLIITGGSAVSRLGAGGRNYSLVNEPEHHARLARVADAVHAEGGRIALQLFHAGRYAPESAFGLTPLAPSPVYSRLTRCTPREADEEDIRETIGEFAAGASVARELGFDAVEVMASEGYLINQFLSPATNQRDDSWGGDPARRRRFALEIARRVRAAVGEGIPVLFRISGADLVPDSGCAEEPADLAVALAGTGVDAIDVGIGWHESRVPTVQTVVPPAMWAPWAGAIKTALLAAGDEHTAVIASNRINRLDLADDVLARTGVDFVSLSRPFLADPDLVRKTRTGGREPVNICIACNQACIDRSLGDDPVSCLVNPRAGRELDFPEPRGGSASARRGRYAVIGAGPAGLEAARSLAALGHAVEIFESAHELGGQFRLARTVPGKDDFGRTLEYYREELGNLGATIHTGHSITRADGARLAGFDGAILATGVVPRSVDLPGISRPHVRAYPEAFAEAGELGRRVAVIGGGGIAVDLAHRLTEPDPASSPTTSHAAFRRHHGLSGDPDSQPGHTDAGPRAEVVLMRRHGKIGAGMGITTRWAVLDGLRTRGTGLLTGVEYREIAPEGIRIRDAEGNERFVPADTVVVAAGQEPLADLVPVLDEAGIPYRIVGGARDTSRLNAVRATEEGLRAAHELAAELESGRLANVGNGGVGA